MVESTVRLRPVTEADLPDYVVWLNDPEVMQFLMREPGGVTLEGEYEWLAGVRADPQKHLWAIEATGRHIGNCGLHRHDSQPTAEMGIAIGDKSAWGRGYGTAAVSELLRTGFQELGLRRIFLRTWSFNHRAQRCYRKCGFRHEGTQRQAVLKAERWIDVIMMSVLREEWEARRQPADGLCQLDAGDADAALALWEQLGLSPHAGEDRQTVTALLSDRRAVCLGWRQEGRLVATIIGTWDGHRGWLYRLGVAEPVQRQGIATALVEEVERQLRAAGARQVNLMAWQGNAAALALYQGLGYELISEVLLLRHHLLPQEEAGCG